MTSLPQSLAESIKSFGVSAVYGDSLDVEGTTVVPVALLVYGFGGGGSAVEGDDADGAGGGGGGGYTLPIGAYIGDSLGVRFQPNTFALLAVGVPFVWASGKALSRIIRALKK